MSFMQPNPLWLLVPLGARRALRPNEACSLADPTPLSTNLDAGNLGRVAS